MGSLQGRAVAVKRLLRDFVTLADREVGLLKDADDHPNVIRYYYQESHASFLYIALELCPASLADIIERPDQFRELAISFNSKRAVRQITSGLRHLHALKIVHRDIKPQNILISGAKKGESNGHRMLISDFGLCRKLELDQTSFLPTTGGAMGVGTFGWRAPEILRGEVKLDETITDDNSQSSRDSVGTATGSNHSGIGKPRTRLTKSVDIFALGCLYYYCLTNGGHPFGDRFERELNIIRDQKSLQGLEGFGEEGSEAVILISSMLAPEAADRCVANHPSTLYIQFVLMSPTTRTQKT
jgi:serine/threonine-protein kinase/endoribonuclease IRE1